MTTAHGLAVCIGHFRIPSRADLACLRHALTLAPRCLLVIGSAHLAPSPRNPFGWEERARMLLDDLTPQERSRVEVHPLREWYDAARAEADLLAAAARHGGPGSTALVVQADGEDADRLPRPRAWSAETCAPTDTEALRELLLDSPSPGDASSALAPHLGENAARHVDAWLRGPMLPHLQEERRQLALEKRQWSVAPYPVVLVTVDAIVRAAGHVLLVRRGRQPGKGLWATPGGFLEPAETVYRAAVRELVEETQIDERRVHAALRAVRVFEDPRRSQRGRVITHAHFFDLGDGPLPPVRGGDAAAAAQWVPIADLPGMEAQMMDDHFHILDSFLGLLG